MKHVTTIGALSLSLFAAIGAVQPLQAAKATTTAIKGSASAIERDQRKAPEFCVSYRPASSRILRQGCKTKADWEAIGIDLVVQK